jgi:hypothetical protein
VRRINLKSNIKSNIVRTQSKSQSQQPSQDDRRNLEATTLDATKQKSFGHSRQQLRHQQHPRRRIDLTRKTISVSQDQQGRRSQIPRGQFRREVLTARNQLEAKIPSAPELIKTRKVKGYSTPSPSQDPRAPKPGYVAHAEEMYSEYEDYGRKPTAEHADYFPDMFGATTDEAIEKKKARLKKRKGKGKKGKLEAKQNKNLGRQIRIRRR